MIKNAKTRCNVWCTAYQVGIESITSIEMDSLSYIDANTIEVCIRWLLYIAAITKYIIVIAKQVILIHVLRDRNSTFRSVKTVNKSRLPVCNGYVGICNPLKGRRAENANWLASGGSVLLKSLDSSSVATADEISTKKLITVYMRDRLIMSFSSSNTTSEFGFCSLKSLCHKSN